MSDLQIAKKNLEGNTICLVKKDSILTKKRKRNFTNDATFRTKSRFNWL